MLVLGLETSCDDTAAAVLQDGKMLLSNIINDQTSIHSKYGGIVPELAGRSHIDQVHKVIGCALDSAKVKLKDIDLLAVTVGPGLIGSLLVGLNAAKGISYGIGYPVGRSKSPRRPSSGNFLYKNKLNFPLFLLLFQGGTPIYTV